MTAKSVPGRKITIRDLARELGVSDRSVSQALNPRSSNVRLNPETAERIRLLAEKRNYRPDTSARAMRYGRFFNLGYFEAKQYPTDFPLRGSEGGIHDAANRNGYRVILIKIPTDGLKEKNPVPFVFREANLDALIVSNVGHLSPECKEAIDSSGLPVIYLNEKKQKNSVYVDDLHGAKKMTGYLIEQGYRKIYYLKTVSLRAVDRRFEHYSARDRIRGYERTMAAAGLTPQLLEFSPNWLEEFRDWRKKSRDAEAIVCPDDFSALRLFRVLYEDRIAVPGELAVTGYGDDFAEECPVQLTTMRIPFYEMGKVAAEMAIELLKEPEKRELASRVFKPELVIRSSTGCRSRENSPE